MLDPCVLGFVRESLPPAPARVLEVGAGDGELAAALASAGYDVVAIDPASTTDTVRAVPLHELSEPAGSFDAAVAVVSMHHVEPLRRSCRLLAEVVRPGGKLVLDEIDVERFDESAARWWLEHRPTPEEHEHEPPTPEAAVAFLRHHMHHLDAIEDALVEGFELGPIARGPYLYRWELGPEFRAPEEALIAAGRLPAVGVRLVGTRRPGPA
ncbi:MAG TPA: methyltransferase domain-containing protein [Solirubrobacteraceae bacterium]|nr:methyltransferase domain-containing protein [Solirubrobacteraceae bacterium]